MYKYILGLLLCMTSQLAIADEMWQLSSEGIGPIKIGMTLPQVSKVTGMQLSSTKPDESQAENNACFYTTLKDKKYKDLFMLMIADNTVARIDLTSSEVTTTKNARIGDSEDTIKKLYPNIKMTKHHYDDKGHYLTIKTAPKRAIRFETDGKKVTQIYGGRLPEVNYVEGCL